MLLEQAWSIHSDPLRREASCRKIKEAVYDELTLYTKNEFLRLVWMRADNILGVDLYNKLTPEDEPRTLKNLVKRIKDNYSQGSPHEIFVALNSQLSSLPCVAHDVYEYGTNTSMNNKWFESCIAINGAFDPRLIRELWLEELNEREKKQSGDDGMYYIVDGCHRALVYALNLDFNLVEYMPVKVLLCESWSHIYPWYSED